MIHGNRLDTERPVKRIPRRPWNDRYVVLWHIKSPHVQCESCIVIQVSQIAMPPCNQVQAGSESWGPALNGANVSPPISTQLPYYLPLLPTNCPHELQITGSHKITRASRPLRQLDKLDDTNDTNDHTPLAALCHQHDL